MFYGSSQKKAPSLDSDGKKDKHRVCTCQMQNVVHFKSDFKLLFTKWL